MRKELTGKESADLAIKYQTVEKLGEFIRTHPKIRETMKYIERNGIDPIISLTISNLPLPTPLRSALVLMEQHIRLNFSDNPPTVEETWDLAESWLILMDLYDQSEFN